MQRLEVSGAVRPLYGSLGVKRLSNVGFFSSSVNKIFVIWINSVTRRESVIYY